MKKELQQTLWIIIKIYALSISIFFVFRLLLFLSEIHRLHFSSQVIKNSIYAFVIGLRFDIVITGYIVLLPAFILFVLSIINKKPVRITTFVFYYLFFLFSVSFMICAADIPYFNQFFKRFEIGAFQWMDSPVFVLKMILQDPKYVIIIFLFILLLILFYKVLKNIFKAYKQAEFPETNSGIGVKTVVALLSLLLIFVGIRGRLQQKSPIRTGTAYFCNDPFLNQLGLNPVFTLIRSYLDSKDAKNKPVDLMDNQIAVENVKKYFGIRKTLSNSPVAREIIPDSINPDKPNIVLIIMESMTAANMRAFGNKDNLTPFLDSLSRHSYFFKNIYTAGEHTYNGIFSTLFSYPALFRQHTMKKIRKYSAMSYTLKQAGYSTTFFIPHDGQFDNTEGFLHANDFDNVITQSDYPAEEIQTTLGVPDDYMFRFSISKLNDLSKTGKPFFVAYMTASNHVPFYIPAYFQPENEQIKKQVVEYSDWSLQKFISLASKTDWFKNTIFVFIADHGAPVKVQYPISLNYHHSPLIIYAPALLKPKEVDCIGGQIDVFPTIMGIIKQAYINNTFGIDLLHEKRPYIIINGDDKVAALDNDFLFVMKNNKKYLFKYKKSDQTNYIQNYPDKAKDMELYIRSNLQTYQFMLTNENTLNLNP